MGFVACMKGKGPETVRDAFNVFKIGLLRIGRFHTDRGGEFSKHMDHWLEENSMWPSATVGYDTQVNGTTEACVGVMARGCRKLLHQAGAPRALWAETITFMSEVRHQPKRQIDDTMVEPLFLEMREDDETVETQEQDRVGGARRQTLASRVHGCLSWLRQNDRERNSESVCWKITSATAVSQ